jgi:uncharacterized protein
MILPDLNLLLYAYNPHAAQHARVRQWWEHAVNGRELIGLPHEVTLGFVRIATNPRLGNAAVSLAATKAVVDGWLDLPIVRVLLPRENHVEKVLALMERAGVGGQLTSDASLAVYAMDNRATLCSNDGDFARFPGLSFVNPLLESD